ncbi:uncharacterized protein TNCT_23651 [Trichonephila clavata]|uniref:Uncharacterized protein n=1 Tax=Trichonephila clavata TaxID=2740835 RepID=A0A8X6I183_TRICU|nr:uncharacterized protein TNCT_23651 [Trichonephila clavata]
MILFKECEYNRLNRHVSHRGHKCKPVVRGFVMYTDEPGTTFSQNNAKSCIQALLKNREQNPVSNKSPSNSTNQDISYFNHNLGASSDLTNLERPVSQEFDQSPGYYKGSESNLSENLDNQNDFNYSQKLFHIADGNLYSIFSPIQGRSYGMKPSFLRKQKYTVQECHSRGRKNLRKGLKFHNFLPSESVTSEKDNGYLRSKWKVHSECRLREEHGTKQITISNWSQSVQNSSSDPIIINKQSVAKSSTAIRGRTDKQSAVSKFAKSNHQVNNNEIYDVNVDPYDFSLSLQNNTSFENNDCFSKGFSESTVTSPIVNKAQESKRTCTSKKDSLNFVLNTLLDRPETSENRSRNCDKIEDSLKPSCQNLKHRRKPLQTRRVVPYVKYLSIMEENEGVPLDLSAKCVPESPMDLQSEKEDLKHISEENIENNLNSLLSNTAFVQNHGDITSASGTSSSCSANGNPFQSTSALSSLLQNQIPASLMFLSPSVNNVNLRQPFPNAVGKIQQDMGSISGKLSLALNGKQIKIKNSFPQLNMNTAHTSTDNMPFSVHKSLIKESQSRTRRRNQRSVIKQKLEDTFKQNGFLVKTKQVSDGEATFCKFRQLRKYTRYYLKSWQHHLPDEVNKMWKGFLPPKTVLPPASGSTDHTDGTAR